jgi:hypothetical protein
MILFVILMIAIVLCTLDYKISALVTFFFFLISGFNLVPSKRTGYYYL